MAKSTGRNPGKKKSASSAKKKATSGSKKVSPSRGAAKKPVAKKASGKRAPKKAPRRPAGAKKAVKRKATARKASRTPASRSQTQFVPTPEPKQQAQFVPVPEKTQAAFVPIPETKKAIVLPKPEGAARPSVATPPAPKAVKPKAVKPKAVKPKAVKPKAVKPKAVKPKAVKPKAVKPKAVKPKAVKPKAVKPKAVKPKAVKPKAVKPKAVKPKAVKPKAVKPKAVKPKAVKPKAVKPKKRPKRAAAQVIEPIRKVEVVEPDRKLEVPAAKEGNGKAVDAAIRIKNLTKSFGPQTIFEDVSFDIPRGEISIILGPSGTGKSVFLKHLVGLLKPDRGEVWIDEYNVPALPEKELYEVRKKFGVLFQDGALFGSMNIYDNTAFPLREHTRKSESEIRNIVQEKLGMVGLQGAEAKFPAEISGGMKKRAGLARALVLGPEIILFDEPDSGLDPVRTAFLCDLIVDLKAEIGSTMIVVTHHIPSARQIADYIGLLFRRHLITFGPSDEMFSSNHPVVKQFLSGATEGPIGMSEEQDQPEEAA